MAQKCFNFVKNISLYKSESVEGMIDRLDVELEQNTSPSFSPFPLFFLGTGYLYHFFKKSKLGELINSIQALIIRYPLFLDVFSCKMSVIFKKKKAEPRMLTD